MPWNQTAKGGFKKRTMVAAGKQHSELTNIMLIQENITDLAKNKEVYVLTNTQKQIYMIGYTDLTFHLAKLPELHRLELNI